MSKTLVITHYIGGISKSEFNDIVLKPTYIFSADDYEFITQNTLIGVIYKNDRISEIFEFDLERTEFKTALEKIKYEAEMCGVENTSVKVITKVG